MRLHGLHAAAGGAVLFAVALACATGEETPPPEPQPEVQPAQPEPDRDRDRRGRRHKGGKGRGAELCCCGTGNGPIEADVKPANQCDAAGGACILDKDSCDGWREAKCCCWPDDRDGYTEECGDPCPGELLPGDCEE